MTIRAAILALLLLAAVSTAADGRVAVIAHRGWHRAPGVGAENSIAALAAAQEAGFWGSEFDVHMTLDERLVVRHDDKIRGTNIWQQTYADIADFALSNGERLPTLDEYLSQGSRSKSTMLVLEVKKEGSDAAACRLADLAVEAVRRHGLLSPDRIMFISFSNAACRHLAAKLPGFQIQCITTRNPDLVHADGVPGIDFLYSDYASSSRSNWIARAHELGMAVGAWTVDATNAIDSTVSRGVDAITSNYPDRVRERLGPLELADPRFTSGIFAAFAHEGARKRTDTPVPVPFAWLDDAFPRRAYFPAEFHALALSDPDGDGLETWAEYLCGTDPSDPSSRLLATIEIGPDGEPLVGWNLVNPLPGSTCVVEGAPSLSPAPSWSTHPPATPSATQHPASDIRHSAFGIQHSNSPSFFRVRLSYPGLD